MRCMTRLSMSLLTVILFIAAPVVGAAQDAPIPERSAGARSLVGQVIHDETGAPLQDASLVLAPASPGILTGDPSASAFLTATRTAFTDADGRYRFDGVPAGSYV